MRPFSIAILGMLIVATAILPYSAVAQDAAPDAAISMPDAGELASTDVARSVPRSLKDYNLKGMDQKVVLDALVPWEVPQLIQYLAHAGDLNNIVIGNNVSGETKLKFNGVTVGDALEVVLSVNNLAYEVKGGIITIITDEDYKLKHGVSFYDKKDVQIIKLRYADPTRVLMMLEKVKSTIGTAVADQVTGTIILIDTPDKINEMRAVIEKADISTIARVIPTVTKTFALQHAKVVDMQAQIQGLLSKDAGSLHADLRTKTIIVTDLPHAMAKIEALVKTFDRKPKQVFVEAKIVEVALGDEYSLGVNWQHMFEGMDPRFALQTVSAPGAAAVPTMRMTYNTIVADGNLEVILEALKKVGDTKILSNPQIAVMDGEEATIEVVEDQPYKEVAIESGTTNVTGVTYIFKPVGVLLNVTPRINDEEFITCAIKPEISSISQWYDGAPQEGTPVIKKAHAETTVMVKDGVTIIIGGLIKDRKDQATSSVPFLGSLPIIGRLFRYDTVSSVNTETVVFLTPRIITGEEPFLRMKDIKKMPKPLRSVGVSSGKQIKPIR